MHQFEFSRLFPPPLLFENRREHVFRNVNKTLEKTNPVITVPMSAPSSRKEREDVLGRGQAHVQDPILSLMAAESAWKSHLYVDLPVSQGGKDNFEHQTMALVDKKTRNSGRKWTWKSKIRPERYPKPKETTAKPWSQDPEIKKDMEAVIRAMKKPIINKEVTKEVTGSPKMTQSNRPVSLPSRSEPQGQPEDLGKEEEEDLSWQEPPPGKKPAFRFGIFVNKDSAPPQSQAQQPMPPSRFGLPSRSTPPSSSSSSSSFLPPSSSGPKQPLRSSSSSSKFGLPGIKSTPGPASSMEGGIGSIGGVKRQRSWDRQPPMSSQSRGAAAAPTPLGKENKRGVQGESKDMNEASLLR